MSQGNPSGNYARMAIELFAEYGDAEAIVDPHGRRYSYAEVRASVVTIAATLWRQGLRPGDAIGSLVTNSPGSICLQLAAHLIGCRTAWIASNTPYQFRQDFMRLAQINAFVYETEYFLELGRELAAANPGPRVYCIGPGGVGQDLTALESIVELPDELADITEEPQSVFQTGGTTGEPKLVHHRHSFFQALHAMSVAYRNSGEPQLRHLLNAGTWHVSAQTAAFMTLFTGGLLVLQVGMNNDSFLRTIEQERINSTLLSPVMLYTLLDDPILAEADCSSLRTLTISGGAASPARLAEAIERLGPVIRIVYGMSESPFIAALPNLTHDPAAPQRLASCGVPYGDVRIEIRDEADNVLPVGEVGEVYIAGSLVMTGYWGRPELTAETLVDGWLRTGDVGRLDEDGYLYLVDRAKDMIVTGVGASNVYCRPVEDALATHPQVRAAAVIGVPHAMMGERVHAFVVVVPNATVTESELCEFAVGKLNALWSPKSVEFVDAFPLTGSGKVDKKALRQHYLTNSLLSVTG